MIEYIKGALTELTPASAVVETGGVGYQLLISLNTYSAIQGKKEIKLFVNEVIREDAHLLFGFSTKDERRLFELLVSVSGIGGQTGRMILSAFTAGELINLIQNEDARSLKSVKGIGPKAAQRIIVELQDKVSSLELSDTANAGTAYKENLNKEIIKEAVSALSTLGFSPVSAQKCVTELCEKNTSATVEFLIKEALKLL